MAKIGEIQALLKSKADRVQHDNIQIRSKKTMINNKLKQETDSNKAQITSIQPKTSSLQELVALLLIPETDYGLIPNCKKPSLFKAGAEKLCKHFNFTTSIEIFHRTEDFDKKVVFYEVKVTVKNQEGKVQAEGIGACHSMESKFLKTNFYSVINTVLKIAKKRAYVDAILTATHTSGIFTQDVEDIATIPSDKAV